MEAGSAGFRCPLCCAFVRGLLPPCLRLFAVRILPCRLRLLAAAGRPGKCPLLAVRTLSHAGMEMETLRDSSARHRGHAVARPESSCWSCNFVWMELSFLGTGGLTPLTHTIPVQLYKSISSPGCPTKFVDQCHIQFSLPDSYTSTLQSQLKQKFSELNQRVSYTPTTSPTTTLDHHT